MEKNSYNIISDEDINKMIDTEKQTRNHSATASGAFAITTGAFFINAMFNPDIIPFAGTLISASSTIIFGARAISHGQKKEYYEDVKNHALVKTKNHTH